MTDLEKAELIHLHVQVEGPVACTGGTELN